LAQPGKDEGERTQSALGRAGFAIRIMQHEDGSWLGSSKNTICYYLRGMPALPVSSPGGPQSAFHSQPGRLNP
jgi:hypothetical protein